MVVVDSYILILLSRVGRLSLLRYFKEVWITPDIYGEVVEEAEGKVGVPEIKKACGDWIKTAETRSGDVGVTSKLEAIEEADISIILLAKEINDILLTNDRALIQVAKSMVVDCWWLTTFLLKLVKEKKIGKEEAKNILFDLIEGGMRLRVEVYAAILREIDRIG